MREVAFIKQNKEKWLEFEKTLYHHDKTKNIDEVADLFIKLNNDLAYAQTYYPKSNVIRYLNALSSKAYHKIYAQEKKSSSIVKFWKIDIPIICYQYRHYLYAAMAIFMLFTAAGALSAAHNEDFVRAILGDDYVNQTIDNIENGDPLAVYTNESPVGDLSSFLAITINNILVSFQAFIYGLPLGIGTLKILMQNGVMLGAFQYMFYDLGHFGLSLRTIWIHGAMEIFSIMICGGAGLILGTSYLFPGKLTRKQSFIIKGKQAIYILISTLPFFIAAGLLEGFVTQYANDIPPFVAWLLILVTFFIISYYYLIYPYVLVRRINYDLKPIFDEFSLEKY